MARYAVLKLEELIGRYINSKGYSTSENELKNMIIEGEDLLYVLNNLEFKTNLKQNIEKLIMGKTGDFIDKIKEIIKDDE